MCTIVCRILTSSPVPKTFFGAEINPLKNSLRKMFIIKILIEFAAKVIRVDSLMNILSKLYTVWHWNSERL